MTDTTTSAVPTPPTAAVAPEFEHLDPRRWIALLTVLTATFMVLLDISIVNVGIPAIRNNLKANDADIQFVVAGYALAYALVLITGGRLGDIYGRKRMFMIGMGGFVAASALCGLAQTAIILDLSRVLQGVFAALMFPQVLSVIQVTFPPSERAKAFGILGAIIGVATITGPLAGGLIIRDDLTGGSWRWIFLVNLPIGLVSLFAAWRVLTESRAPHATRLDLVGVAIASIGLFLLVYPLVQGQTSGWPAWTFVCIGLSPVVLALFVLYERQLPADRFPLVQLSLFRIRSFRVGTVISAVFLMGIPAFFFTFSLTVQAGLGFSALNAGLTTVPFSIGSAVASAFSARLAPKLGKWTISIGSGLLVLGMLGIILTLQVRGASVTGFDLIPSFLVSGVGLGTVVAPLLNIILAGVPPRDAGSASGVLTTFQQLGGALGVALVGVIFFGMISGRADTTVAQVVPQLRTELIAAHVPPQSVDAAITGFARCFHDRAAESDPTRIPPSCRAVQAQSVPPQVEAVFTSVARQALGIDFVSSFERTLPFNASVWFLTGLLALLLPKPQPRAQHAARTAAAAAH